MSSFRTRFAAAFLVSGALMFSGPASAENILGALAKAYQNNASLNSARAGVRVVDEDVAIAKSGYRPTIAGVASINLASQGGTSLTTGSFGVEIQQPIFDGLQTRNGVLGAEASVRAEREILRNTEQNTLFNAASAFMDVILDRRIAGLREQALQALDEQIRAAQSRLEVGEGTRTDVAQAQAARAAAIAQLAAARASVTASAATYRQLIGSEPGRLDAASPQVRLIPGGIEQAFSIAASEHPAILATQHYVDAAGFGVKRAEGALLPQLSATAGITQNYRTTSPSNFQDGSSTSASIGARLSIPIYQGGRGSAQVRQNKERLGQARIEVDVSRDQVRQAVAAAWTQYVAARETVDAGRQLISAAQLALNGVVEERNVGQRTTLDVLNAQANVIDAQITVAEAERNVVVASYAIASAIGRLTPGRLGLNVAVYKPEEHYEAVKDKWFGLRTPDGR